MVVEIDQIQRQGQKPTRSFSFPVSEPIASVATTIQAAPAPVQAAPAPVQAAPAPVQAAPVPVQAAPAPVQTAVPEPVVTAPVTQAPSAQNSAESKPVVREQREGRVKVQWSGSVVIELQLDESPEKLELRQKGDLIEIHFADGKAFHIPFRVMA
ncbi:MAG: hypothetical protein EBX52_12810 [Proteobacteria bacterium]|nr:hypothetical protein [Pseudomonadota bacterium]